MIAVFGGMCVGIVIAGSVFAEATPEQRVQELSMEEVFDYASRYPSTDVRRELKGAAFNEVLNREESAIGFMLDHAHIKNIMYQVYLQQLIPRVPAEKAVPPLLRALGSEHDVTRRTAVYFLGLYEDVDEAPRVAALLGHEKTRGMAVRTLGKWRALAYRDQVRELLEKGEERERVIAVNALRDMGGKESVPDLIQALKDEVFTVRFAASRGLAVLEKDSLKPVQKALEAAVKAETDVRELRDLVRTLGAMKSSRANRLFRKLCRHDDTGVATDAQRALDGVFREVLGVDGNNP